MSSPDINRLMDNARVKLPGALDAALQMELFLVMKEFFDNTNIWEEEIPFSVTPTNLFARWANAAGAETHEMDVGLDTNFAAFVPGYEAVDVRMAEQYLVEGLAAGTWYALRVRARNERGYSWPSRTVWVPAGMAISSSPSSTGTFIFAPSAACGKIRANSSEVIGLR